MHKSRDQSSLTDLNIREKLFFVSPQQIYTLPIDKKSHKMNFVQPADEGWHRSSPAHHPALMTSFISNPSLLPLGPCDNFFELMNELTSWGSSSYVGEIQQLCI